MTIEEAEDKLSNMSFDSIVKSYCNKVNYIEQLKSKINDLSKLHQPTVISEVCEHNFVPSIREAKVHTCVKCNCQRVEIAN